MVQKIVLLPGMNGTGALFAEFVNALHNTNASTIVSYPLNLELSYAQLMYIVGAAAPITEPYILLAESFSTPLAIQFAATQPPNLRALVLCAGFATSPVRGWQRFVCSLLTPILFRLPLTRLACKVLLVGLDAPASLVAAVRGAISSVHPKVLSARLRAVLTCDARAELAQVTVPILYVQAEHDRLVRGSCLEEIRQMKPQAAVAFIAGPHLILQREPRQAAMIVADFIRRMTDN